MDVLRKFSKIAIKKLKLYKTKQNKTNCVIISGPISKRKCVIMSGPTKCVIISSPFSIHPNGPISKREINKYINNQKKKKKKRKA